MVRLKHCLEKKSQSSDLVIMKLSEQKMSINDEKTSISRTAASVSLVLFARYSG